MTPQLAPVADGPGNVASPAQPDASAASWYGLAVLIVVSLYAVVDRQVFVLLAEPMRLQLGLTDLQLGTLQGLGVSLFAAVVGYPIGWLADRIDRRRVLAGCIVVWSLAVVACGLAQGFEQLLLASAVVGAGEAGVIPIVFALIPEMFRNSKRQLANSVNMVVGRLGVGVAIAFCGLLTQAAEFSRPYLPLAMQGMEGWRLTFFAAALPAPLFVLLLLALPVGGRSASGPGSHPLDGGKAGAVDQPTLGQYLAAHRAAVAGIFGGLTLVTFGLVAVAVWLPVVAMRQFGATPLEVGNALGLATFVASAIGMVFTVYGLRWLAPRFGPRLPVIALALACGLAGLCALLLPLAGSSVGLFVIYGVLMALLMMGFMTYPTVLQEMAPAHLRSRLFAIFGVLGIVFPSAAPPLVGFLSDQVKHRPDGLLLVTVAVAAVSMLASAGVLFRAARRYASVVAAVEAA